MTVTWFKEMIELSLECPGWHLAESEILDHYFVNSAPEVIVLELTSFVAGHGLNDFKNIKEFAQNDVYEFIQGPSGPFHFIKDARVPFTDVVQFLAVLETPFHQIFKMNNYSWTAAWSLWRSFFDYSSPFIQEGNWMANKDFQAAVSRSACNISKICDSGLRALNNARRFNYIEGC